MPASLLSRFVGVVLLTASLDATAVAAPDPPARPPLRPSIETDTQTPPAPIEKLHAVLLNGGGSPAQNFSSHLSHLKRLHQLLRQAGLDEERITVFSSDGDDPGNDLAVAGLPPIEGQALLEGTEIGERLAPSVELVNSEWPELKIRPATRRALRQWFQTSRTAFHPGDTLFLFVTDHGTNPSANHANPRASRITLWGRDELSVRDLRDLLETLDPRVRVITVMSQCFSGGFAHLFETHSPNGVPSGAACGYFSSTPHRPAYGCYPETAGDEQVGHAFEFMRALAQNGSFADAHLTTLERDDTPDVPLRSSDAFLQNLLEENARKNKKDFDQYGDEWLSVALRDRKRWESEIRLLDRLGTGYGLLSPRSFAELEKAGEQIAAVLDQVDQNGQAWAQALGDLTGHNLRDFIEHHPTWRARLSPRQLAALPTPARRALAHDLLEALRPWSVKRPQFLQRLDRVFGHIETLHALNYRMEVRLAVLLRMRTVLAHIAGRFFLEQRGSRPQVQGYQALARCEMLDLPLRDGGAIDGPEVARHTNPIVDLASDLETAKKHVPAGLGIEFQQVSAGLRKRLDLPAGASLISRVMPDTPADGAGLVAGDIIIGEPGHPFTEANEVRTWTMLSPKGKPWPLRILRNGQQQTVNVVLQPRPTRWPEPTARPLLGSRAPGLERLAPYRGEAPPAIAKQGPYLLFFFATWCGPCKQAVPELLEYSRRRNVPVIAITDEDRDVLDEFFSRFKSAFPTNVASDEFRTLFSSYAVSATPTFVLIGADGSIQERIAGYDADQGLALRGWRWKPQ